MADAKEAAKAQLAKDAEARKKSAEEVSKRLEQSKPTPSQEENDLAKLGVDVAEKADDGSGPELKLVLTRQTEAAPQPAAASYQTRQTKPTPPSGL